MAPLRVTYFFQLSVEWSIYDAWNMFRMFRMYGTWKQTLLTFVANNLSEATNNNLNQKRESSQFEQLLIGVGVQKILKNVNSKIKE